MADKIYVVSCRQDLASMGIDRMRSGVEGISETGISLDWTRAKMLPVVAAEKVHFEEGETKIVPIKLIKIQGNAMVFDSFYGVNGMGHLSCIGSQEFRMFSEERTADVSMFSSRIKAAVMKGDLLAIVAVVPGSD
jgi:hypothetical protein